MSLGRGGGSWLLCGIYLSRVQSHGTEFCRRSQCGWCMLMGGQRMLLWTKDGGIVWWHAAGVGVGVGPRIAFGNQRMIKFRVCFVVCASLLFLFLGWVVYLRCADRVTVVGCAWGRTESEMERMGTSSGWLRSTEGCVSNGIVCCVGCSGSGSRCYFSLLLFVGCCCSRGLVWVVTWRDKFWIWKCHSRFSEWIFKIFLQIVP